MSAPTQVARPWRTTVRTVFQFVIALATVLPFVVAGVYSSEADVPAIVGQVLVVAATITRVMALPEVEGFLQHWFPWLAADPDAPEDRGAVNGTLVCAVVVLGLLGIVVAVAIYSALKGPA